MSMISEKLRKARQGVKEEDTPAAQALRLAAYGAASGRLREQEEQQEQEAQGLQSLRLAAYGEAQRQALSDVQRPAPSYAGTLRAVPDSGTGTSVAKQEYEDGKERARYLDFATGAELQRRLREAEDALSLSGGGRAEDAAARAAKAELDKWQRDVRAAQSGRWYQKAYSALDKLDDETRELLDAASRTLPEMMHLGGSVEAPSMDSGEARRRLREMGWSDEDIRTYSGYSEARRNAASAEAEELRDRYFAEQNPVLANAVSVMEAPFKALGLVESVRGVLPTWAGGYGGTGRPTDVNSPFFAFNRSQRNIRGETGENIEDDAWRFLYNAGMSAADSALNMAIGSGIAGAAGLTGEAAQKAVSDTVSWIMGSQVAADTVMEEVENGYSNEAALGIGIARGLFEHFSEKYSIENILKNPGAWYEVLGKSFVSEGSEEVASNWLNRAFDSLIGHKTDVQERYEQIMASGETDEALALARALVEVDGESFLAGGISGLGMSGVAYGTGTMQNIRTGRAYQTGETVGQIGDVAVPGVDEATAALIESGLESPEGTDSRRLAERAMARAQAGQEISARMRGELAAANAAQVASEESEESTTEGAQEEHPAGEIYGPPGTVAPTERNAARAAENVTLTAEDRAAEVRRVAVEEAGLSAEAGDTLADIFTQAAPEGANPAAFAGIGGYYYQAGEKNIPFDKVGGQEFAGAWSAARATEGIVRAAWNEGRMAALARQAAEDRARRAEERAAAEREQLRREAERNRRLAASEAGLHEDDFTRANLSADDARRIDETARLLGTPVYVVGNNEIGAGRANGELVEGRVVLLEQGLFEGENAGTSAGLRIAGHEWGHRLKRLAPAEYGQVVEALRGQLAEEIENKRFLYNEQNGLGYSDEALTEEAVNDRLGDMLRDGRILDEFIEEHRQERGLLQRMWEGIKALARKLTGAEKRAAQSAEAKLRAALDAAATAARQESSESRVQSTEGTENAAPEGGAELFSMKDQELPRRFIRYSDTEAYEEAVSQAMQKLLDADQYVTLNSKEIGVQENAADWTNRKAARKYVKSIVTEVMGDSVYFQIGDETLEAYFTDSARSHFSAFPTAEKAAAAKRFGELVQSSIYAFSAEHDIHSEEGKRVEAKQWDYFVAAVRIGDTMTPILFSVRTIDDDFRAQIYAVNMQTEAATSHGNASQDNLQSRSPNYEGVTASDGDRVPQDGGGVKSEFSLKEPDAATVAELRRQNKRLRERYEHFKGQTRQTVRTGGKRMAELWQQDVNRLAKELREGYSSGMDATRLRSGLKVLGEYLMNGERDDGQVIFGKAKEMAVSLAQELVENGSVLVNEEDAARYKELRKHLRGTRMSISAGDAKGIADFKGWQKAHFGSINVGVNNGRLPVDTAYQELNELFPGWFPEEISNPTDQLERMAEVLDSMRPIYENPYSVDMATAIESAANEILERLMDENVRQAPGTFADKAEMKRIGEWEKAREQYRGMYQKAVEREREARRWQVAAFEKRYSDAWKKAQANKAKSAAQEKLLKIARRLQNKKLPQVSRNLLDQYIGELDTVSVSMTGRTLRELEGLRQWYHDKKTEGSPLYDPDFIPDPGVLESLERLEKKQIGKMSMEEVRELTDVLLNIENELRTASKLVDSADRRDVHLLGEQVIRDLGQVKGSQSRGPRTLTDKVLTATLSPIRQIRRMVGYVETDPLLQAANALADGQREMYAYQMRAGKEFTEYANDKALARRISGKDAAEIEISGMSKEYSTEDIREAPLGKAVQVKITPAMRMSLYLHSLNEDNLRHIAEGGMTIPDMKLYKQGKTAEAYARGTTIRMTPSQVKSIAAGMTERERAFARAAHAYFNGMSREAINEVSEKLKGYSLAQVENYYPITTDRNFLRKEFDSIMMDGSIEGMGFLKERVFARNPIMLIDMNTVLDRAIQQHSRYYGLAIPLRNFSKIFGTVESWRGPSRSELAAKDPMRIVDIREDVSGKSYAALREEVMELAQKRGWFDGPHFNADRNTYIFLNKDSLKHSFSNLSASSGADTILVMKNIPDIIRDAVLTKIDKPKDSAKSETRVLTFFAAVRGEEGVKPVKLTVKEYTTESSHQLPENVSRWMEKNGDEERYQRLYDAKTLEVIGVEEIKKGSDASTQAYGNSAPMDTPDHSIKITDLLDLVKGDARKYIPGEIEQGRTSVQQMLSNKWGERGYGYIEKMVADLSGAGREQSDAAIRLSKVRSNYAGAVLSLNASVAMKQAASYPTAAAVLGWKPLAKAMKDFGGVTLALIERYTPLQWYRSQGFSTQELGDIAKRKGMMNRALNLPGLNWIQGADLLTTRKLWKASEYYVREHDKGLKVGSDEYYKAVAAIYNRVIEETQPNYTTMQRPQLLRSDNTLMQNLTMFKTQPFQNFNILYDAAGELSAKRRAYINAGQETRESAKKELREAQRGFGRAVTSQLAQLAIFSGMTLIWNLFRGNLKKYRDDDDELTAGSILAGVGKDMLSGLASIVPFGSDLWEVASSQIFGETYYGFEGVTESAINDLIDAVRKALNGIGEIVTGLTDPNKKLDMNEQRLRWDSVLKAATKVLGVPYENVENLVNAVVRWAAIAIGGEYRGTYAYLNWTASPSAKSKLFYDNLYKAYRNDPEGYAAVYQAMIQSGNFDEEKIRSAMEDRMKKTEGVRFATDLEERYLSPERQAGYDTVHKAMERSPIWRQATEEQRGQVENDLYRLAMGRSGAAHMQEIIDDEADVGLDEAEYLLYRLALSMADEPTESGKYGSYTNDEVEEALRMLTGLSDRERSYLWISQGKSEKNNPWG